MSETTTPQQPGRGRKQCPSCKTYVGVRTTVCSCSHSFERKSDPTPKIAQKVEKKVEKQEVTPEPQQPQSGLVKSVGPGDYLIQTPAGKCPVKLEGDLAGWAYKVVQAGQEKGRYYSESALAYFLREFYNINSPEYQAKVVELKNVFLTVAGRGQAT